MRIDKKGNLQGIEVKVETLFRMGFGALRHKVTGKRIPLNVMFSVTNRCTSHCSYCDIPMRRQRELTTGEIKSLILEMKAMGTLRLGIWGGEPLVRDDIGEIIDFARMQGLYVTLDSNGYLFEKRMKELKNLGHIIFALDGPEEIHDMNRGAGSFRKAMKAIKLAKVMGMKVWTITVLTKDNIDHIPFIFETAKEIKFIPTFQILHHNEVLGRNRDPLMPENVLYREAIKRLMRFKRHRFPMGTSYTFLRYLLRWDDYAVSTKKEGVPGFPCLAGRIYCNIDTDGTVYPCSLLIEKYPGFNALKIGFRRAFENLEDIPCQSCVATCFTEYNYLYGLHPPTIIEWVMAMRNF